MVVLTVLGWLVSKAARVLAAASAALGRLAAALGAPSGGSRPAPHPPADPQDAAPQHPPGSGGAAAADSGSLDLVSMSDEHARAARAEFLRSAKSGYGYGGRERELRGEFSRLNRRVYVDHAGATLYSQAQLRAAHEDLAAHLYTNPHSGHASYDGDPCTADAEAAARAATLAMCNAPPEEYECIFTSGATAAMKLVAEAFPWSARSRLAYTRDNHNSAVGMREAALRAGATAAAVDFRAASPADGCSSGADGRVLLRACSPTMSRAASNQPAASTSQGGEAPPAEAHSLFVYPLESNFSGARYCPGVGSRIRQHGAAVVRSTGGSRTHTSDGGASVPANAEGAGTDAYSGSDASTGERWCVLLDAAKACCSAPPDLAAHPVEFVALSFYKVFGYPTGLGALLARRDALPLLAGRAYFGGGAVAVSVADADFFRRRPGAAGLEDGTPPYLACAALRHGYAQLARLGGFPAVERHTAALTRWLAEKLAGMRHPGGGRAVCVLYGAHACIAGAAPKQAPETENGGAPKQAPPALQCFPGAVGQGPVVAFNVLRADGAYVGYREVEKLAGLSGIMLRSGCFCNPGACAGHLGLTNDDVIAHYHAGHVCWDDQDIIDGRPTGAVRVSFGYMSTFEDAYAVYRFITEFFVGKDQAAAVSAVGTPAAATSDAAALASVLGKGSSTAESLMRSKAAVAPQAIPETESEAAAPRPEPLSHPNSLPESCMPVPDIDNGHQQAPASAAQPSCVPLPDGGSSAPDRLSSHQQASSSAYQPGRAALPDEALPTAGFAAAAEQTPPAQPGQAGSQIRLARMWVYPIKSCAGFEPGASWPLGPNGLLYDREWALVDAEGAALTLKKLPRLAMLRPTLDLEAGVMRVSAPGNPEPCLIPLPRASPSATASSPPAPAAPVPQPSASGAAPTTAAAAAASTRPGGGPAGHVRAQAGQAPSEQLPVVFAASSYSAADVAAGSPVPELATKDGASPAAAGGSAPHRSQPRGRAEGASAAGADSLANDDVSDAGSDAGSFTGSLVSNSGLSYSGSMQGSFTSTGSAHRAHFNAAMWPGRSSFQCDRPSAASPLKPSRACSGPATLEGPAAVQRGDPGAPAAAEAGSRGAESPKPEGQRTDKRSGRSKVLDLRAVRSRFRHLRGRASSGSPGGIPGAPLDGAASQPLPPTVPEEAAPVLAEEYALQAPPPQQQQQQQQRQGAGAAPWAAGSPQEAGAAGRDAAHADEAQRAQQAPTHVKERSLQQQPVKGVDAAATREVRVCADCVCSSQVGESGADSVSDWFSAALGVRCWLVQQLPGRRRAVQSRHLQQGQERQPEGAGPDVGIEEGGNQGSIGFANEAQFLAMSAASLDDVNARLRAKAGAEERPFQVTAERFRPNLLLSGVGEPYAEDAWRTMRIGGCAFSVTGPCARCEVVCADPGLGARTGPEPLLTLAAYRRMRGRIHFGVLLEAGACSGAGGQRLELSAPVNVAV